MTSLVSGKGWIMTGPMDGQRWSAWREVAVAWAFAALFASTLVLAVPTHHREGSPASPSSFASAAGHAHPKLPDAEGPRSGETCSDRDYVNERC
jgi:hypothetical protein